MHSTWCAQGTGRPFWLSNADISDLWPPLVLWQLLLTFQILFLLTPSISFLWNPRSSWNRTKHFILFLLSSISTLLWCPRPALSSRLSSPSSPLWAQVRKRGLCLFSHFWMSIKEAPAREIRIEKGMLFISTSEEMCTWVHGSLHSSVHPHQELSPASFLLPPPLLPYLKSVCSSVLIIS